MDKQNIDVIIQELDGEIGVYDEAGVNIFPEDSFTTMKEAKQYAIDCGYDVVSDFFLSKKTKISNLVVDLIKENHVHMLTKIKKILDSGAVNIDKWDSNNTPMILPKTILIALLEDAAEQYSGRGTSFEKQIKKEVKNIRHFI